MVLANMDTKTGSFSRCVTKKAGRAKERLLQNLGKADKTTDEMFEIYNNNFNKQANSAVRLQKELKNYVTCLRALQSASKNIMDCVQEVYEPEWPGHEQVPVKGHALEVYFEEYCHKLNDQVTIPLSTYLSQFSEIRAKIAKRGRKLVDYDGARHTVESLESKVGKKDEIRIAKSREQMEEARRLYEVLNKELQDELPALFDSRVPFLISSLQTLFGSENMFHSEARKIFSDLSELISMLAIEAQKGSYHTGTHNPQYSHPIRGVTPTLPPSPPPVLSSGEMTPSPSTPVPSTSSPSTPVPAISTTNTTTSNITTTKTSPVTVTVTTTPGGTVDCPIGFRSLSISSGSSCSSSRGSPSSSSSPRPLPVATSSPECNPFTSLPDSTGSPNPGHHPPSSAMISVSDKTEGMQLGVSGVTPSPTSPERKRTGGEGQEIPLGATTTNLPPGVLYKVKATYKYVAEDQDELNFEVGEMVRVVEYEDPEEQEDGWLLGIKESTGEKGLFPANFTRPV